MWYSPEHSRRPGLVDLSRTDGGDAHAHRRTVGCARHAWRRATRRAALARLYPAERRTAVDGALGARAFTDVPPAVPGARGARRTARHGQSGAFRPAGATSRARTSFRLDEWGALAAEIEIRSAPDLTELLAHEFEHLIEQLDGVDLQALARKGEARRLSDGAFETDRAVAAGQQVAGESRRQRARPRARRRRVGLAGAAPRRGRQGVGAVGGAQAEYGSARHNHRIWPPTGGQR